MISKFSKLLVALLGVTAASASSSSCGSSLTIQSFYTSQYSEGSAVSASVPSGWKLIGGGFQGQNLLESYPSNSTTWTILTSPVTADVGPAPNTAYAIGLYDPDNCYTTHVVQAGPFGAGSETATGSASCAYPSVLVGGGATSDNFLIANYPNTIRGDSTSAFTWTASFAPAQGFVGNSQTGMTVYAICVDVTGSGYSLGNFISSASISGSNSYNAQASAANRLQIAGGGFRSSAVVRSSYNDTETNSWVSISGGSSTTVGNGDDLQSFALGLSVSSTSASGSSDSTPPPPSSGSSSSTAQPTTGSTSSSGSCVGVVQLVPRTGAGATWSSEGSSYKIFDISVINQGTCAITSAAFPYYFIQPGTITSSWNVQLQSPQGYGSVSVYSSIQPGATYTVAGIIVANYTTFSGHFSAEPVQCSSC